jgi:hypothetical protein
MPECSALSDLSDAPPTPEDAAGLQPSANPWDVASVHESALRELLRSPLDAGPRRRRGPHPGRRMSVLVFMLAAGVGAGLTVAGAALAGGSAPAVTTTVPTTTTVAVALGPALPTGYYPIGEGFGARVERVLVRADAVFVSLSLAVDEDHDPADTTGHQGGQWQLEFPDGSTVRSAGVAFDPVARAAATIAFPAFDQDPTQATLHLLSAEELHTATYSSTVAGTVAALPATGTLELAPQPATFPLDGGGTLRLGTLSLEAGGGHLEWTVEGTGITAHVNPGVAMEGLNGTVMLVLDDPFFQFRNRTLSSPPPTLATSGTAALVPLDTTRQDPGAAFTVTLSFEVTWATPLAADATLPVAGAQVVDVTDAG